MIAVSSHRRSTPRIRPYERAVRSRRLASIAIAVMIVAAFLPWLRVSIDILGVNAGTINATGNDIGSDFGIQYGYLLIGAAVITGIVLSPRNRSALVAVSVAAVLLAGYAALTAQSHGRLQGFTANGQPVPRSLLNPHASLAYGVVAEAIAAIVLLVAALGMPRRQTVRRIPQPG